MEASSSGVKAQLTHWNTHAIDTKVPEAKNAGAIRHHNNFNIVMGPVLTKAF
jgi:hypothetical protein